MHLCYETKFKCIACSGQNAIPVEGAVSSQEVRGMLKMDVQYFVDDVQCGCVFRKSTGNPLLHFTNLDKISFWGSLEIFQLLLLPM